MREKLLLVVLSCFASVASAQGIPLLSVEITGGSGPMTVRTATTSYDGNPPTLLRAAATVRLGTNGRIRPIITAERSTDCPIACGDKVLICRVAPGGGCYQSFSSPRGSAISVGVAGAIEDVGVIELTGGVADYWTRARFVDANISIQLFSHWSAVVGARHVVGKDRSGDPLWFFPRSIGVRIH